jgi:hypothetical protein
MVEIARIFFTEFATSSLDSSLTFATISYTPDTCTASETPEMLLISLIMEGPVLMSQFKKTKAFNMFYYTRLKYKKKKKLRYIEKKYSGDVNTK